MCCINDAVSDCLDPRVMYGVRKSAFYDIDMFSKSPIFRIKRTCWGKNHLHIWNLQKISFYIVYRNPGKQIMQTELLKPASGRFW